MVKLPVMSELERFVTARVGGLVTLNDATFSKLMQERKRVLPSVNDLVPLIDASYRFS